MGTLVDFSGSARRSLTAGLPLVACDPDSIPEWHLEWLGEDRFRLTVAAGGRSAEDIMVSIVGGLLLIEDMGGDTADGLLDCSFVLLEPLSIVRVELREGMLAIELERDRATPCKAVVPPVLNERCTALALAA